MVENRGCLVRDVYSSLQVLIELSLNDTTMILSNTRPFFSIIINTRTCIVICNEKQCHGF